MTPDMVANDRAELCPEAAWRYEFWFRQVGVRKSAEAALAKTGVERSLQEAAAVTAIGFQMAALCPFVPCIDENWLVAVTTVLHERYRGGEPMLVVLWRAVKYDH